MMNDFFRPLKDRFCKRENRLSFALNHLDLKLADHLEGRNKFFIEAGGNDGLRQSNTMYFEKYLGWKGLLVEAVPTLAEQCRRNRPKCIVENYALVSKDYKDPTIDIHYRDLMSMIEGGMFEPERETRHLEEALGTMRENDKPRTFTVKTKTISQILDTHGIKKIDFFSLDVEGYELEVLKGLDLDRHCPEFLLLESRDENVLGEYLQPWLTQKAILHAYPNSHRDILYQRTS